MIDLIILIAVIYYIYKKVNQQNSKALLYQVFNVKKFSNIKEVGYEADMVYIRADGKGENFLFVVKNNSIGINSTQINNMKLKAQQCHVHNIVFVTNIINDLNLIRELKINNIKFWDSATLKSFLNSNIDTESTEINKPKPTILSTSDTSNDTCNIDPSSYNPIQEGEHKVGSIFSGLFDKPDRL